MSDAARRAPAPTVIGLLAAPVYRAVVERRNRRFDRRAGVTEIDPPVISVGNLSVGGSGKTPMTIHIVDMLLAQGLQPAIAMRGHKPRGAAWSDEARLHRERHPSVPVVAQPDRIAGLRALFDERARRAQRPVDVVVLDDGFQHRKLARDLDLVLIDATRSPFDDRCLPAGWLREPVTSLARADAVIVTRADAVSEADLATLLDRVAHAHGSPALATIRHAWSCVRSMSGDVAPDFLIGRRVYVACGVGHPWSFVEQAKRCGAEVVGAAALRDHVVYTPRLVRRIRAEAARADAELILTTEKDWVKWREIEDPPGLDAPPSGGFNGEPPGPPEPTPLCWAIAEIELLSGAPALAELVHRAVARPSHECLTSRPF